MKQVITFFYTDYVEKKIMPPVDGVAIIDPLIRSVLGPMLETLTNRPVIDMKEILRI